MGETITREEVRDLHRKQELRFDKVSHLIQLLPPDMMFIIRASNLVAIHNNRLGGTTRERLFLYSEYAYKALYPGFFSFWLHKIWFFLKHLWVAYFPV